MAVLEDLVRVIAGECWFMVRRLMKMFMLVLPAAFLATMIVFLLAPSLSQDEKVLVAMLLMLAAMPFLYYRLKLRFMSERSPLGQRLAKYGTKH